MLYVNLKRRLLAAALTILTFFNVFTNSAALSPVHIIRICQNKDCRKRFSPRAPDGSLVQTVQDLLPADGDNSPKISIESSGCLSQCGKGPNICVENCNTGKERLFFGVDSASAAAAILDVACDYDPEINLILAADKISKAQIASSPYEKEAIVAPVIENLQSSDSDLSSSPALSHALALRADARLDYFPQNVAGALEDSRQAVKINPNNSKAWRILADAEEASGNIDAAIEATSKWGQYDPRFATKAKNEISRLRSKL